MNRFLGRFTRSITRPGQMFPLGFLFGLGFDTATEVTLMVMAGSGAAAGLPWYAILCLPLLFAAGMSLFDTLDGTFMNFAYQWAFSNPVRKVYYNLTITGLSIAVAFFIGTIELVTVLHDKLGLNDPLTGWISGLDLDNVGFIIVGLFVVVWAAALALLAPRRRRTTLGGAHVSEAEASPPAHGRPVHRPGERGARRQAPTPPPPTPPSPPSPTSGPAARSRPPPARAPPQPRRGRAAAHADTGRNRSTAQRPGPVSASAAAPAVSSSSYSTPLGAKKPPPHFTARALIIVPTTAAAASGVSSPTTSPSPPSISLSPATTAIVLPAG